MKKLMLLVLLWVNGVVWGFGYDRCKVWEWNGNAVFENEEAGVAMVHSNDIEGLKKFLIEDSQRYSQRKDVDTENVQRDINGYFFKYALDANHLEMAHMIMDHFEINGDLEHVTNVARSGDAQLLKKFLVKVVDMGRYFNGWVFPENYDCVYENYLSDEYNEEVQQVMDERIGVWLALNRELIKATREDDCERIRDLKEQGAFNLREAGLEAARLNRPEILQCIGDKAFFLETWGEFLYEFYVNGHIETLEDIIEKEPYSTFIATAIELSVKADDKAGYEYFRDKFYKSYWGHFGAIDYLSYSVENFKDEGKAEGEAYKQMEKDVEFLTKRSEFERGSRERLLEGARECNIDGVKEEVEREGGLFYNLSRVDYHEAIDEVLKNECHEVLDYLWVEEKVRELYRKSFWSEDIEGEVVMKHYLNYWLSGKICFDYRTEGKEGDCHYESTTRVLDADSEASARKLVEMGADDIEGAWYQAEVVGAEKVARYLSEMVMREKE